MPLGKDILMSNSTPDRAAAPDPRALSYEAQCQRMRGLAKEGRLIIMATQCMRPDARPPLTLPKGPIIVDYPDTLLHSNGPTGHGDICHSDADPGL